MSQSRGPWQEVWSRSHSLAEIDTPAFRDVPHEGGRGRFAANVGRLQTNVEDLMPWKLNGEKWHLGDKGFPAGKKVAWDRAVLPRLLKLVREVEPALEIKWDVRDAVTLRVPGVSRFWGRWKTKQADALECWFVGKPGQFNLSQVERFGRGAEIAEDRNDGCAVLKLRFTNGEHLHAVELRRLLAEHLRGFREAFEG